MVFLVDNIGVKRIVGAAMGAHEPLVDIDLHDLAGQEMILARVRSVDQQYAARLVEIRHHRGDLGHLQVLSQVMVELGFAVAVRMVLYVFLPQEEAGHVRVAQLFAEVVELAEENFVTLVGEGAVAAVEHLLELRIVELEQNGLFETCHGYDVSCHKYTGFWFVFPQYI